MDFFTFISDRDKGIIAAVNEVFPTNHHAHCIVHIARNVVQYGWGIVAGKSVSKIAQTFDFTKEYQYFEELRQKSKKACDYLSNIDPKTWRCTAWMGNELLPPRYGIYTSNTSESANNMFKEARQGSWLDIIDTMLDITIQRNAALFEKYKTNQNKQKVVSVISNHIKNLYNVCSGFVVTKIDDDLGEYKVNRSPYKIGDKPPSHCVNPKNEWCSCGKWQDREYPCIDAIAYFKNSEHESVENILMKYVLSYYTSRNLYYVLKKC